MLMKGGASTLVAVASMMSGIDNAYPSVDYDDLMAGVDALVARGCVDQKRLYATGVSGVGLHSAYRLFPLLSILSGEGQANLTFSPSGGYNANVTRVDRILCSG